MFGISFTIPDKWFVVDSSDFKFAIDNQKFVGEYEYHRDKFDDAFELPSLLTTKFNPKSDKYYGLVTPTLNFQIIAKDPDYTGMTLQEYAELIDREVFGYHLLKDFRIINRGQIYNVNGFDFIKYDTEYLFENREIEIGFKVELSILNIDYGDFILDFSMTDCKAQNQIETDNFNMIIDSIELKN